MATGAELLNKAACNGALAGFNMDKGCTTFFKDVKEIWRTPVDFEFDGSVDFDEDYIKSLQLAGKLTIVKNITDFPEGGSDPLIESLPDGTEIDAGDAKYKYSPVWAQDLWLNVQLGKLEGQNNNRFVFVDSSGNLLVTKGTSKGNFRGFKTSRTKRMKLSLQTPGVGAKQSLDFQLADTYELEDNVEIISSELLDFEVRLIESIVQGYIEFNAVPANLATTIVVKALVDRGKKTPIIGLTTSGDFKVTINGVEEAASVAVDASGIYTITTTALATNDVVEVSINGVKEVVGDALYVSNTDKAIVV